MLYLGPMLYLLSAVNLLVRYSDDINLFVPSASGFHLIDKFNNVIKWAGENRMKIKTTEIVSRRSNTKFIVHLRPLEQIEQLCNAKLLVLL